MAFSAVAATPQARLHAPAAAELRGIEAKLDRNLLPGGTTQLEFQIRQIFNLVVKNTIELALAPVRFKVPVQGSPEETSHNCGLYLISADGMENFIRFLSENLPIQCWSIDAIRLERIDEDHPSIILTGNLTTGSGSWLQLFALRWDNGAGTYKMDTVDFK